MRILNYKNILKCCLHNQESFEITTAGKDNLARTVKAIGGLLALQTNTK
jgi:hypothetical protein